MRKQQNPFEYKVTMLFIVIIKKIFLVGTCRK